MSAERGHRIDRILRAVKSRGVRADARPMDESQLLFWLVCGAVAAWGVAGSVGAIAKRLDDQVRRHDRCVESKRLRSPSQKMVAGQDEWDVDILPDGAGAVATAPERSGPAARKAA